MVTLVFILRNFSSLYLLCIYCMIILQGISLVFFYVHTAETIAFYALDPSNSEVQVPGSEIYHIYPLTNLSIFQVQRGRFKLDVNPINYDGYTYYSSYEPPPLELYTKFSLFGYNFGMRLSIRCIKCF